MSNPFKEIARATIIIFVLLFFYQLTLSVITPIKTENIQTHGYLEDPEISVIRNNYFVSGDNRDILCDQIYSGDRILSDSSVQLGHVHYEVYYEYYPIEVEDGFTVGSFTVNADSEITLPQWTSSAGASEETLRDWNYFRLVVENHEQEHQYMVEEMAYNLTYTLNNFGAYDTEENLDVAVVDSYYNLWSVLEGKQSDLDSSMLDIFEQFCFNEY